MINTLQHIGIGVRDVSRSFSFYRDHLGFRMPLSEMEYDVWELEPMFGRKPRMHIHNSFNPYGGPTLELFQHIDTQPREKQYPESWGDIGFLELGIQVRGLEQLYEKLRGKGVEFLTGVEELIVDDKTWRYAYLRDPDGQLLQLLDMNGTESTRMGGKRICGINHVGIGVSDFERSMSFYCDELGFDKRIYHSNSTESGLSRVMLIPGAMETIMLGRSTGSTAQLSFFNGGMIKLIHCDKGSGRHVFEGRRFGDLGLVEIGLDVDDTRSTYDRIIGKGVKPLVPPTDFDWGFGPCGTLAYLEDPDGNVIELVELKSLIKVSPRVFDWLVIRPLRLLERLHLL